MLKAADFGTNINNVPSLIFLSHVNSVFCLLVLFVALHVTPATTPLVMNGLFKAKSEHMKQMKPYFDIVVKYCIFISSYSI